MKVGSLFSGVGGFDLGLERAGMEIAWQVEIDPQSRSVLRHHWPNAELHKDVNDVGRTNLAPVDLICGGFPCQDLSVAGKREGMAGQRSGLWWEFHRILGELTPRWCLIENVPGLLSSNEGRDMLALVDSLEQLGYGWSYRILDSQHFGVAQRRRRVFIVGHLGGPCPPEILLESEGVSWDSEEGEAQGEGAAEGSGSGTDGEGSRGGVIPLDLRNATRRATDMGNGVGIGSEGDPSPTLTGDCVPGVVSVIDRAAFNQGQNAQYEPSIEEAETLPPLVARGPHAVMKADGFCKYNESGVAGPLRAVGQYSADVDLVLAHRQANAEITEDQSPTLSLLHEAPIVFRKAQKAHDPDDCERWEESEVSGTLNGQGDTAGMVALNEITFRGGAQQDEFVGHSDVTGSLAHTGFNGEAEFVVGAVPRRLTPTECERLQGFPDGWTRLKDDGTELADSPRYRMMGNAVTVNVAEWIGKRIIGQEKG